MVARILFAGLEQECVTLISGYWYENIGNRCDPNFADLSLGMNSPLDLHHTSGGLRVSTSANSTIWFHANIFIDSNGFARCDIFTSYFGGSPRFKIRRDGNYLLAQSNTSLDVPVWTTISVFPFLQGLQFYDFRISPSGSGEVGVTVFIGNSVNHEFSFTNAFMSDGSGMTRIGGDANSLDAYHAISEVIITEDIPTTEARVKTIKATGAGSSSQWTGTYEGIAKNFINDSTNINSSAAGEVSTFVYEDITVPDALEISSLWLWNRAKGNGENPDHISAVSRIGTTNYTSPPVALPLGFSPIPYDWPLNPATGQKWEESEVNSAQLGSRSSDS